MSVEFGEILHRLVSGPLGKQAEADIERDSNANRHLGADRLIELDAKSAARNRASDLALAASLKAVEQLSTSLNKEHRRIASIRANQMADGWRDQTEREAIITMLRDTSAPAIKGFIAENVSLIDTAQRREISSTQIGLQNPIAGFPVRLIASEKLTVWAFLDLARETLAKAKDLQLLPDQTIAAEKIPALRERLHSAWAAVAIETLETVRPIPIAEKKS